MSTPHFTLTREWGRVCVKTDALYLGEGSDDLTTRGCSLSPLASLQISSPMSPAAYLTGAAVAGSDWSASSSSSGSLSRTKTAANWPWPSQRWTRWQLSLSYKRLASKTGSRDSAPSSSTRYCLPQRDAWCVPTTLHTTSVEPPPQFL